MPDIGQIGPTCSDPTHHADPRHGTSSSRITLEDGEPDHRRNPHEETLEDRARRIESIRRAIETGTYPSDEKLEVAMKRMIEELSS